MNMQQEALADVYLAEALLTTHTWEFVDELVNVASLCETGGDEASYLCDPEAMAADLNRDAMMTAMVRVTGWLCEGTTIDIPVCDHPMLYGGITVEEAELRTSFIDMKSQISYTARIGDAAIRPIADEA